MFGQRPAGRPLRYGKYATPHHLARVLPAIIFTAIIAFGCSGGSKKKATPVAPAIPATPSASTPLARSTLAPATPTIVPSPTIARPFTPPPNTPQPTATPVSASGIRTENGLQIQDGQFLGRVTTPGGVRIRSAPDASAPNVVGSVPEGALVTVEGKVLNGSEAEPGKGTVWYIVGSKQYIYGAEGYVQRVDGTPAR